MNSLKAEIARETRMAAPMKGRLEGVKVGDTVYIGNHRDVLRPYKVEKVNKLHIVADGDKFRIDDGVKAGKSGGFYITRAQVETKELREAYQLHSLKMKFEHELAVFRSKPELQTKETMLAILKLINPEAWK